MHFSLNFFCPLGPSPPVPFSTELFDLHRSFGEGVMWSNLVFLHSFIFICL